MFIWLSSSKEEDLEEARREGRNKGTFITTLSLSLSPELNADRGRNDEQAGRLNG